MAVGRKATASARQRGGSEAANTRKAEPPFSGAHFRVLIGAKEVGFCQITRLQAADAETPHDGAPAPAPRPSSMTLRRAITQSKDLYTWRDRAATGKRDLRTVTIHQTDPTGRTLNTFVLHGCRPVKWSGPEFNALGNDIAMEELEICCDRVEWR